VQLTLSQAFSIVKSILKPTIPLSPPKSIPSRASLRAPSPGKSHRSYSQEQKASENDVSHSGLENVENPFIQSANEQQSNLEPREETVVALRTEEQQQAAAREREKAEILARRDARRKSLANRRVSFAPEATLHTWDVVELAEDATTSSEATNSTRRASSGSTLNTSSFNHTESSDPLDAPSTPSEPTKEIQVERSPVHQRDAHQKKRRRSSTIPPMNFNNLDDYSSSPMSSPASDDTHQSFVNAEQIDASESDDEDDDLVEVENTVTGIAMDDLTNQSVASSKSDGVSSTNSSTRLERNLRHAAHQAGTQGIEYDELGDQSMELADDEITSAFQPWAQKMAQATKKDNMSASNDHENRNPFSPAFKEGLGSTAAQEDDGEMTMDMTVAAGGIIKPQHEQSSSPKRGRRKSGITDRRRSTRNRRASNISDASEDVSMELTTVIGGIQPGKLVDDNDEVDQHEEMTMEFTSIVGGLLNKQNSLAANSQSSKIQEHTYDQQASIASSMGEDDMDMTMAIGGILSPVTERTEPAEDGTMAMDITRAIGAILPKDLHTTDRNTAKILMEEEAEHGQLTRSPFPEKTIDLVSSGNNLALQNLSRIMVSSQNARGSDRNSTTPQSARTTPLKKPTTPTKQLTPRPLRPTTPSKTPPSKNVSMRKQSPVKLFKAELKKGSLRSPAVCTPTTQNKPDVTNLSAVPALLLTPRNRRVSGLGANKEGLGSPRVTALLDRRASIGDNAKSFVSTGGAGMSVRFQDPRELTMEVDAELASTQRQDTTIENDATANLKDMIQSLTPKKNKLKGRKSLHVGAAKGLLGKRPAELDEDDEDGTPKRPKTMERSPVKSVKLPAPPTKMETTGKLGKAPRFNLSEITGNGDIGTHNVVSPQRKQPLLDAENPVTQVEPEPESCNEDRVHLQDFLNMTSIRFMELTTTKRRHTVAPSKGLEGDADLTSPSAPFNGGGELEDCVVAGACTVPMLELYQHSCRELKKYIAEGRSIVQEIEADTYEDNPALFREYMTASPSVRAIMDNQFKNVKTHARLLSKGMWYEWRMKLLDGLKEGLVRISDGLEEDSVLLGKQEEILNAVVPGLVEEHMRLENEASMLQAQAEELENCDQDELNEAREDLGTVEQDIEVKKAIIAKLQEQFNEKEVAVEQILERKQDCLAEIKEAERVREDCRGWTGAEVAALKSKTSLCRLIIKVC
jgi:kinetochore protein Spc7/SPC105